MEDLVGRCIAGALEGLSGLDNLLPGLKENPHDRRLLVDALNCVHLIRNSSGFLGLQQLESITHSTERLLTGLREGKLPVTAETASLLLAGIEAIRTLLDDIRQHGRELPVCDARLIGQLNEVTAEVATEDDFLMADMRDGEALVAMLMQENSLPMPDTPETEVRVTAFMGGALPVIPVLAMEISRQAFGLPAASIVALINAGAGTEHVIDAIDGAPVMRWQGGLLPLISAAQMLGLPATEGMNIPAFVAVCKAGNRHFGLVVDKVYSIEEIMLRPMPEMLAIPAYCGCAIRSNGSILMVLDPGEIAAQVNCAAETIVSVPEAEHAVLQQAVATSFLLLKAGKGAPKAVPLEMVECLHRIDVKDIELAGGVPVVQYHGGLMRLVTSDTGLPLPARGQVPVVVFAYNRQRVGLVVESVSDIAQAPLNIQFPAQEKGWLGSMTIGGRVTDVVDVSSLLVDVAGATADTKGVPYLEAEKEAVA